MRLVRSKHIYLVASWNDGGVIAANLTRRQLGIPISSPIAEEQARLFDANLKKGAGSRILTPGFGLIFALWPLMIGAIGYLSGIAVSSEFRKLALDGISSTQPTSHWLADGIMLFGVYTYPLTIALAITILYIRVMSGGLRIRRMTVTKTSILQFFFRLRKEVFRREHMRQVWISSTVGIIVAFATFWFTK